MTDEVKTPRKFDVRGLNADLKRLSLIGDCCRKSIRLARIVAHQIPLDAHPQIGPEANSLFLHFEQGAINAYLTFEPHSVHLFLKKEGHPNIYIDDAPMLGKRLPRPIRAALIAATKP